MRLEPIILELEREQNDLLIIAHESVLRVLYAYLMHCSTMEIPKLKFPRDEIIEIIPAAYQNEARRIHIPGLDPKIVPSSPEDIKIPVPSSGGPSGTMSPIQGLGTPAQGGMGTPVRGLSTPVPEPADQLHQQQQQQLQQLHQQQQGQAQAQGQDVAGRRLTEKVVNSAADSVADKLGDVD